MNLNHGETRKVIQRVLDESLAIKQDLARKADVLAQIADCLTEALKSGQRIYLMGNGGSAADCQHIAAELVGRFKLERQGFSVVALTTNTSILTALGNDFGFEQVFVRQVQALVSRGDVVVGLSTSGRSRNVIEAARVAKQKGATVVGLVGPTEEGLGELCDLCLLVEAEDTARIQEAHMTAYHIICELVESALAESES